jgi:hypothetical protein
MKRIVVLLGVACLGLILLGGCGKQEEPAKAEKPAATQAAPTQAPAAKPEAPTAPKPEATPAPTQPAPAQPEKK